MTGGFLDSDDHDPAGDAGVLELDSARSIGGTKAGNRELLHEKADNL